MAGQKLYLLEILFKSKDKRFQSRTIKGLYAGSNSEKATDNTIKLLSNVLSDDPTTPAHELEVKSVSLIRHEFYFHEKTLEKQLNLEIGNGKSAEN